MRRLLGGAGTTGKAPRAAHVTMMTTGVPRVRVMKMVGSPVRSHGRETMTMTTGVPRARVMMTTVVEVAAKAAGSAIAKAMRRLLGEAGTTGKAPRAAHVTMMTTGVPRVRVMKMVGSPVRSHGRETMTMTTGVPRARVMMTTVVEVAAKAAGSAIAKAMRRLLGEAGTTGKAPRAAHVTMMTTGVPRVRVMKMVGSPVRSHGRETMTMTTGVPRARVMMTTVVEVAA